MNWREKESFSIFLRRKGANTEMPCHLTFFAGSFTLLQKKPSFNFKAEGEDQPQAFVTKRQMVELVTCLQKLCTEGKTSNRD